MYKWDEMNPAQRDLLVAEKVFGWKIVDNTVIPTGWKRSVRCPSFSTDISAAWEVVEKFGISIIPQSSEAPSDMKYMAVIESTKIDRSDGIREFAATAPEAICKAALKIVGVDIE